jgi:hypothetical protein
LSSGRTPSARALVCRVRTLSNTNMLRAYLGMVILLSLFLFLQTRSFSNDYS